MEKLKDMSEKAGQNFKCKFCKKMYTGTIASALHVYLDAMSGLLFINYPNLTPKNEMMKLLMRLLQFTSFTFEHFWESPPVNTPSES